MIKLKHHQQTHNHGLKTREHINGAFNQTVTLHQERDGLRCVTYHFIARKAMNVSGEGDGDIHHCMGNSASATGFELVLS